jgi:hypothetical protein
MKKFAMVMVALVAFAMIVNCAKKEEVVQKAAQEVETPAPVAEAAPVVADSAAVAVTDTTAAVATEQPAEAEQNN